MKQVTIYCDGSCSATGKGAFASILISGNKRQIILGFENKTTSNRMEIKAALMALKSLSKPCRVIIFSDNLSLINRMTGKSQTRYSLDLYNQLDKLSEIHQIVWRWVRRNSIKEIRLADKLAHEKMKQL